MPAAAPACASRARAAAALLLVAAATAAAPAAAAPRPNILWLQTDSLDGRLFDPGSAMYAKLKLSGFKANVTARAWTFARHYTNSPQCVPSRTSMVTGRYVHETRTTNNGQGIAANLGRAGAGAGALDSNCVSSWNASECRAFAAAQGVAGSLLDVLAGAGGYAVHAFGRFDVGAGVLDDYPGTTTGDGFHGGPSLSILLRGAAIPGQSKPPPLATTDTGQRNPFADDERHTAAAAAFLRGTRPPGPGAPPALVWLGVLAPHPPYDTNGTWMSHVNESAVDPPTQPAPQHPYEANQAVLKGVAGRNYTADEQMRMRRAYWGATAQATDMLLDALAAAADGGWLDGPGGALVVITSDHGEMSLERGQVSEGARERGVGACLTIFHGGGTTTLFILPPPRPTHTHTHTLIHPSHANPTPPRQDYKNSLLEPSSRVPLLLMPVGVAGIPPPPRGGGLVTAPTSHIDILPTLLDVAGVAPPPPALRLRGSSLLPYLTGAAAPDGPLPGGKPALAALQFHSNLGPGSAFGIVQLMNSTPGGDPAPDAAPTPRIWKLITYGRSLLLPGGAPVPPQLFDLTADPDELANLAPTRPELVAALNARLEAEFGGPGSLAAIDAAETASNVDLYARWFHAQCAPAHLLGALNATFKGLTQAELVERVTAWTGLDPRSATGGGPGTHCPAGNGTGAARNDD